MRRKDLTGQKFGKLTVIEMLYGYNGTKVTKCLCNCDCGSKGVIRTSYALEHGHDQSCGCMKKEIVRKSCGKNIDGMKFGRLTVIETLWDESPVKVKCLCDCGNTAILLKGKVQNGCTASCGCLRSEVFKKLQYRDYSGRKSEYGVEIICKSRTNKNGQWLWKCKCGFCGEEFEELPAKVFNGHTKSCGCYKKSYREKFIQDILNDIDADYKYQYSFDDCRSDTGHALKFDFAIFRDDHLYCLIEYDGEQHFRPVSIWGGDEAFQDTKRRDSIKNKYCFNNNIPLYRIPYTLTESEIREKITKIIYP